MDDEYDRMGRVNPGEIRYIKLGPGGAWEASSLDRGRLDWGIPHNPFDLADAEDWAGARQFYIDHGARPATATGAARELRDFHTLDRNDLWITFARGHLWWTFAEPGVHLSNGDGKREGEGYRTVIDRWRNTDVLGRPLTIDSLSSQLTQLAGYRGTICSVRERDYLLRRINAAEEPRVGRALAARSALIEATTDLVRALHWADFELLVGLLFERGGWRRLSGVGGTMKDIDLLIEQPLTGERASVQVKSAADQRTLEANIAAFAASKVARRFFFVCHSPRGSLTLPAGSDERIHLWTLDKLAAKAVDHGLTDWLIEKAR